MKTLRLIGMALFAIVMSVNFVACDDDDEDFDIGQLEGTWGLVQAEGFYYVNGQKDSYNETYDPANPNDDSEKAVIKKVGGNKYTLTDYEFYMGQWHEGETETFTLEGNKVIPAQADPEIHYIKVVTANEKHLVIESGGKDEDGDFYDKLSFIRM